ncbi:MAG TPA: hypothetical protein VMH02_02680, partial [Verrucomicrobiae bacterium]|nr:hypothetical protein [Verrucomicrobiae bacterium]
MRRTFLIAVLFAGAGAAGLSAEPAAVPARVSLIEAGTLTLAHGSSAKAVAAAFGTTVAPGDFLSTSE